MLRRQSPKRRLCNIVDSENDSRVLHRATRIYHLCADGANLGALDMLSHNHQPVRFDHFNAIVKEKEPRTIHLLDCMIFRPRITSAIREMQPSMWKTREARTPCRRALASNDKHPEQVAIRRPVVDEDQFPIVICLRKD